MSVRGKNMLAINMKGITKRFPGIVANDNINFKVKSGTIHSLLGENGAGKSTLMKMLFGLYKPDEGEIYINDHLISNITPEIATKLGIGMVHQHFMLIDNLTVIENIILGSEPGGNFNIDYKKAQEILENISERYHFNLDLDRKIKELSVGEKQRVEIMKTLYRGANIIIMDEPTAVLTPIEVRQLLSILKDMRKEGKTIIFITHKLAETMEISDEITILRQGKSVNTMKTKDTYENELARLMVGGDINFELKKEKLSRSVKKLEIKDAKLLKNSKKNINLDIYGGEIHGIAGVDGNGQQELEKIIMGIDKLEAGEIYLNGKNITKLDVKDRRNMGIGYIPADRWKYGVVQEMSLLDNYLLGQQYKENKYTKNGTIDKVKIEETGKKLIENYDIKIVDMDQLMSKLSGGNQQKIVLSREVEADPDVLIVSQPTRGLDIGAISYIKKTLLKLRSEGKAILLISADLNDIFELSDRASVLFKGELMATKEIGEYNNESISLLMAGKAEE